jgi:hypothetical protein
VNNERIIHFSVSLNGRQSLQSDLINFPSGGHTVVASAATVSELERLLGDEIDHSLVLIDRQGLSFKEMGRVKKITSRERGLFYSSDPINYGRGQIVDTITRF